jgi:DNA-binding NarL/FixJ family response regulator
MTSEIMQSAGTARRILIVEPFSLIRTCLRALLSGPAEQWVVEEAADAHEALHMLERLRPDLVLVNVHGRGGYGSDVIRKFKERRPEARILAVLADAGEHHAHACTMAGADAYLYATATRDELRSAASTLLEHGGTLGPPGRCVGGAIVTDTPWPCPAALTRREQEVLELVANGHSTKAVASCLKVSLSTAQRHRYNMMTKLGLHNAAAVTAYFLRNKHVH